MPQKDAQKVIPLHGEGEDRISYWIEKFLDEEIRGVRSKNIEQKIALQLGRFQSFFTKRYRHERVSSIVKRDIKAWLDELYPEDPDKERPFASSTVNNHKAHLSLFLNYLSQKAPHLLPENPMQGREFKDIQLPPPEPRALSDEQVISLLNICDRLERFYQLKGRRWKGAHAPVRSNARPKRDRALAFLFLFTGIRRRMAANINLDQLEPNTPDELRKARKARIVRIRGKGMTEQNKYLNQDLRNALADYLEFERPLDEDGSSRALFLPGQTGSSGRLSVRQINNILARIGTWHDVEQPDPKRHISPLTPHDLRHTYGFWLSEQTNGNRVRLEQELGHRNERYLALYANPPEEQRIQEIEQMYSSKK